MYFIYTLIIIIITKRINNRFLNRSKYFSAQKQNPQASLSLDALSGVLIKQMHFLRRHRQRKRSAFREMIDIGHTNC